ncbi:uncharacterized protein LOC135476792 [Liolophura sinensis]|uniref:uncharacterized protein LOC135476792 n=1 Tax=Liolophura sinensis TaxID=3198878 RepID=UPI0031583D90
MCSCGTASIFLKLAFLVSGLALLFHGIGYTTNSWRASKVNGAVVGEEGLWKRCEYLISHACLSNEYTGSHRNADEIRSVRAFATISFIMLIAVTVAIFVSLCIEFFRKKLFIFLEMGTAIAAGVLIILAVIIYGSTIIPANPPSAASWSLALSIVGAALAFATAVLVAVGGCGKAPTEAK